MYNNYSYDVKCVRILVALIIVIIIPNISPDNDFSLTIQNYFLAQDRDESK